MYKFFTLQKIKKSPPHFLNNPSFFYYNVAFVHR